MTNFDTLKRVFPFLLLFAYGLFMCGYFFLGDYSDHYRLFARLVFPLGLFVFIAGTREYCRHPVFLAIVIYMLYHVISGLWGVPMDWYRLGQKFTISVYLLSFIAITAYLVQWNRALYDRMLRLCVLVAAVAALTSIVAFYRDNPFPGERLVGIGALTNINEFSNVYGVFGLLAVGFALQARSLFLRLLLLAAMAVFICYAWFGQSRTAFVAMIIALVLLAVTSLKEKKIRYAASIAPVVFGAALVLIFPDPSEQAFLRGPGLRPQIWESTWHDAVSAPIAGHGLTMRISVALNGKVFQTAHNAYLQAFWHGGAIGLGLLLLLLLIALRHALSLGRQQGDYTVFCMLVFAAATMLTGVDTLIERPRDQWMLFWFPLALLLSYQRTGSSAGPAANTAGI